MKRVCTIYRSPKHEGMYLYVDKAEDLARVPDDLLSRFGVPEHTMTLLLDVDRKLARVDVLQVLEDVAANGFFLQMPPKTSDYMTKIHHQNSKM